jgi:hypothetical protein
VTSTPPLANCPKCQAPIQTGVNFCGNCGSLISGVWGSRTEMFGRTVAVEVTESTDVLAQLLTSATIGDYDIYGELGRGGMAAVYLALDLSLNRKVAIKTMLPDLVVKTDMVERFKREAQTAAALNHPHIIQIYSVKQTEDLVYFVMKFIEGRSLESVIIDQGQLGIGMTQQILHQVASALAYAHRKGVVHRDVKPANIMVDEDGWAIVTDFGIAKVQVAQNLTATGTAIGTPAYMSPEQFHNKSITGKSDQYSLGIVAYELLLGKKPFDGGTYAEIITQHLFSPVPDLRETRPDLPENISASVMRMLAKNPDERFPDLDAAAAAIGIPERAESERLRGEMISLAKGVRRTVRMSVPVSPIPMTKKPATVAAATVVAAPSAATVAEKPAPMPAPVRKKIAPPAAPARPAAPVTAGAGKGRQWMMIAAAVVVAVGGFGTWKAMSGSGSGDQSAATAPGQTTAPSTTPPAPAPTPTATNSAGSSGTVSANAAPAVSQPSAPPVSTPSAPPARVTVTNVPSGAVITLDGRRQSGSEFSARAGTHQLRIVATGFEPMTRSVTVRAGEPFTIAFDRRQLAAATPPVTKVAPIRQAPAAALQGQGLATLRLIVQPPAILYIDGSNKGEQSRLQEELVPGTHTVRAEKAGFATKDTIVTILPGQTASIRLNLTPRP